MWEDDVSNGCPESDELEDFESSVEDDLLDDYTEEEEELY